MNLLIANRIRTDVDRMQTRSQGFRITAGKHRDAMYATQNIPSKIAEQKLMYQYHLAADALDAAIEVLTSAIAKLERQSNETAQENQR